MIIIIITMSFLVLQECFCNNISQLSSVDVERLIYLVLLNQLDGNLASDVSTRIP